MRARVRTRAERSSANAAWIAFLLASAFILWIAASSLVRAQPAAPNGSGGPAAGAPTLQTPSPNAGQPSPALPPSGETLSERLDRSGGVIKPPPTLDPEIRVPAKEPNAGTMPVIPPPGSPGGNQAIQPK